MSISRTSIVLRIPPIVNEVVVVVTARRSAGSARTTQVQAKQTRELTSIANVILLNDCRRF